MKSENTNKKTTCNKKRTTAILPVRAKVVEITGMSDSYVKKILNGARADNSENAKLVKYCFELIMDVETIGLATVAEIIALKKQDQNNQ